MADDVADDADQAAVPGRVVGPGVADEDALRLARCRAPAAPQHVAPLGGQNAVGEVHHQVVGREFTLGHMPGIEHAPESGENFPLQEPPIQLIKRRAQR